MDNLVLRGHTYHFVRRVPKALQPLVGFKIWKRTLGTSKLREAEVKARQIGHEIDELILRLRASPEPSKLARRAEVTQVRLLKAIKAESAAVRRGDDDAVARLVGECRRRRREFVEADANLEAAKEVAVPNAAKLLNKLTEIEEDRARDPITRAAYAGQPLPANAVGGHKAWYDECLTHTEAQKKAELRRIERETALRPILEKQLRDDLAPLSQFAPLSDDPNNPRLSSLMRGWFAERGQGMAAQKRHTVAVERFIEKFGDVPVREVTRGMVEAYIKAIATITDSRKLPASERGCMKIVEGLPTVAAPTVERHLTSMKAILAFAVSKGYAGSNVAIGLSPPPDTRPKASRRRSFTAEERNVLLSRAVEEHGEDGAMTWLIRLGAYTGARLEELAQLGVDNVKVVDGISIIEIDDLEDRNVKTPSSVRQIPLHSAIRKDFIAFAEKAKPYPRVFWEWKKDTRSGRYSSRLSQDFAALMDRAGLTDKRLVFHSLRHGFKRATNDARIDPEVRRELLGHRARDRHEEYEGPGLATLADEIEKIPRLFR